MSETDCFIIIMMHCVCVDNQICVQNINVRIPSSFVNATCCYSNLSCTASLSVCVHGALTVCLQDTVCSQVCVCTDTCVRASGFKNMAMTDFLR